MAYINPNYLITIQQAPSNSVGDVFSDTGQINGGGVTIHAALPGQFTFDTRSEYQAPFAQGLFGAGTISNLAKVAGIRLVSQAMTAQIWQGATETELGLELEFHAETDPDTEVRQPILALMKLSTASIDAASGMLNSPGPQLSVDADTAIAILKQSKTQFLAFVDQAVAAGIPGASLLQSSLRSETATPNGSGTVTNKSNEVVNNGLGGTDFWKKIVKNQISIAIGRYAFFDSVVITNVQKTYEGQIDEATGLPMYAKVSINFKPFFLIVQSDLDKIFARRPA